MWIRNRLARRIERKRFTVRPVGETDSPKSTCHDPAESNVAIIDRVTTVNHPWKIDLIRCSRRLHVAYVQTDESIDL